MANYGRFAKFAKLSPRQTFPLYGIARSLGYCLSLDEVASRGHPMGELIEGVNPLNMQTLSTHKTSAQSAQMLAAQ